MAYFEKIYDVTTGSETTRNLTKTEIVGVETAQKATEARTVVEQEKSAARAALLDKLGITEDEAALLFG